MAYYAEYSHGSKTEKAKDPLAPTKFSNPEGLARVIRNGKIGDSLGRSGGSSGGYYSDGDKRKPGKEK